MRLINEAVHDLFSNGNHLYFQISGPHEKDTSYVRLNEKASESITKDEYFKGLYGEKYKFIMHYMKENPSSSSFGEDGSVYVCPHQESVIYKFDRNGSLVRKYHEMRKTDNIFDISVQGESIWCVYTSTHTVKRFSLRDGKEELTLSEGHPGGRKGTVFTYPESIIFHDDTAFIADRGNKRIARTDLSTMKTESYMEMPEPVYRYERLGSLEYVLMNADLYELQPGHGEG
ncbi:MAG TPA: hypothetical protein VLN47_03250 [Clostridiaceae bacterium]|nr:hypothetical protein [Clostridiaceae bacterium]